MEGSINIGPTVVVVGTVPGVGVVVVVGGVDCLGVPITKFCTDCNRDGPALGMVVSPRKENVGCAPVNGLSGGSTGIGLVCGGSLPDGRGAGGSSPAGGLTSVVGTTSAATVAGTS